MVCICICTVNTEFPFTKSFECWVEYADFFILFFFCCFSLKLHRRSLHNAFVGQFVCATIHLNHKCTYGAYIHKRCLNIDNVYGFISVWCCWMCIISKCSWFLKVKNSQSIILQEIFSLIFTHTANAIYILPFMMLLVLLLSLLRCSDSHSNFGLRLNSHF